MKFHNVLAASAMIVAMATATSTSFAKTTLEAVKERGFLRCGVNSGVVGFSAIDSEGKWTGLDVDFCRAFAVAVLGDTELVEFIPLSAQARFAALQHGEVDILTRNTTWTFTRDTDLGIDFVAVTFYDGQGFLARKDLGMSNLKDAKRGLRICFHTGTTTETNLADYATLQGLDYTPLSFASLEEAKASIYLGQCDLFTTDRGALASIRATDSPNPDDFIILPDVISKEPLGPAVRDDDSQWRKIVRWVVFATIEAEERGITSANIAKAKESNDPAVKAMLGVTPGAGESLGLDDEWVYRVIQQVGNYGEIFDRNVGRDTVLALERGLNGLWTDGGLMYAPPMR